MAGVVGSGDWLLHVVNIPGTRHTKRVYRNMPIAWYTYRIMNRKKTSMTFDPGLLFRVDQARGDVPRSKWIERAIEARLEALPLDKGFFSRRYLPCSRDMVEVDTGPDDLYFPNTTIMVTKEDAEAIAESRNVEPRFKETKKRVTRKQKGTEGTEDG